MIAPKPWPLKPFKWSNRVTVCIAAVCGSPATLIMSSDHMISMGSHWSADGLAMKIDSVGVGWFSQFSAENMSPVTPIHEVLRKSSQTTMGQVSSNVKKAYHEQRLVQIQDEILNLYGLSWEDFLTKGKDLLTERDFEQVIDKIASYDLGLELLMSGFDNEGPHVFSVSNPGKCDFYDKLGFAAIGSGSTLALASLFTSTYKRTDPLETCILKVLCAKFSAESASGVGSDTFVSMYSPERGLMWLDYETLCDAKEEWASLPRIPTMCAASVKECVENPQSIEGLRDELAKLSSRT